MNNDLSSPELFLLLFRKHLHGDNYQSRLSLCLTSSPFMNSLFNMYLKLEAINVLCHFFQFRIKYKN